MPTKRSVAGRQKVVTTASPTNLSLDPEVREEAKAQAKEEGVSLSLWIERLITRELGCLRKKSSG